MEIVIISQALLVDKQKRTYGEKRRDKDLARRANPQGVGRKPAASEHDLLDVRICFRASTAHGDLS